MKKLAAGVERIGQFPLPMVNVYLAEDVLIDAGTTWDRWRIPRQIKDRDISMLALTHVHPDHQGLARDICRERDIPLACHTDDVAEQNKSESEPGEGWLSPTRWFRRLR